jgi:hypothetical protein
MDPSAEMFLKYHFAETKTLCTSFLTLVSAILVFSITFSEKIVGFATASQAAKSTLLGAWCAFVGSIIACGVGLCLITLAGGAALTGGGWLTRNASYWIWARFAWWFIILAGILFVGGLVALLAAASRSLHQPQPSKAD